MNVSKGKKWSYVGKIKVKPRLQEVKIVVMKKHPTWCLLHKESVFCKNMYEGNFLLMEHEWNEDDSSLYS